MSTKVTYNNDTIAEIKGGQTLTLKCANETMQHDLVIEAFGGGGSVPEWDGTLAIVISFTINGITYYSPEGWTWAEWVADESYNTAGLTLLQSGMTYVIYNGAGYYVVIGTSGVHSDDKIIANQEYMLYSGSSYLE